MTQSPKPDAVEAVAKAIYESLFVDDWTGGRGIEAELYRDAARAAITSYSAKPAALDWLHVAKSAGEHGIRYRTNKALEMFLAVVYASSPAGDDANG